MKMDGELDKTRQFQQWAAFEWKLAALSCLTVLLWKSKGLNSAVFLLLLSEPNFGSTNVLYSDCPLPGAHEGCQQTSFSGHKDHCRRTVGKLDHNLDYGS